MPFFSTRPHYHARGTGADRIRTGDLLVANQSLSRTELRPLALQPSALCRNRLAPGSSPAYRRRSPPRRQMGPVGVEPTTSPLSGVRSNQLSYEPLHSPHDQPHLPATRLIPSAWPPLDSNAAPGYVNAVLARSTSAAYGKPTPPTIQDERSPPPHCQLTWARSAARPHLAHEVDPTCPAPADHSDHPRPTPPQPLRWPRRRRPCRASRREGS